MNEGHLSYLRTMAAHAVHPHAPQSCRDAKAELDRIESAAAQAGVNSDPVIENPALAADAQGEMF